MGKKPFTGADMKQTLCDYRWEELAKKRGGPLKGMKEMILSEDPESGAYTRLVYFKPGFKISKTGKHGFWEEVFIIEGYMIDYASNTTYAKGSYALRQPGIEHGPFGSEVGCTLLETTWYDRAWYEKNNK